MVETSSTKAIAGAKVSATGRVLRTETWHCSQQSREENAGPEVSPGGMCPCDRMLHFMSLQQGHSPLVSCPKA